LVLSYGYYTIYVLLFEQVGVYFLIAFHIFQILYSFSRVAPVYMNVEIGIGEGLLLKIVTEVYGRSEKSVKAGRLRNQSHKERKSNVK
jgi:hypothetical protein